MPVPIMDGVMGIFDSSHTWTHIPEEIHFPLTHLQGQEINLRQIEETFLIKCKYLFSCRMLFLSLMSKKEQFLPHYDVHGFLKFLTKLYSYKSYF